MRVLLSIDGAWRVSTNIPGAAARYLQRTDNGENGFVCTLDMIKHGDEHPIGLLAESGPNIEKVYERLMTRNIAAGDPEDFGRYLFDCLIGMANWSVIQDAAKAAGAWFIELALIWDATNSVLSRLPWELMRGNEYLSNGYLRDNRRVEVAITRLVPNTTGEPRVIEGLPRVLFVAGTALNDPRVRPAAEILCMLTRTREQQRRLHPRMLERASPSRIKDAIANFRPDVVHVLCHGGFEGESPVVWLQSEEGREAPVTAEQLGQALTGGKHTPPIVLLSACKSGAMLGPNAVAPFAAQMVRQGLPIVIGMSGNVSDLACRLFTRRFVEALLGAEKLIEATGEGRRAGFSEGKAPERSIDWAFPAVFLSENVDPDYRPADPFMPADPTEARIRAYNVRTAPVFCGRHDFLQEFETLFRPNGPAVLAAFTPEKTPGYGRKRLLEELAIQAILERHVPLLVTSRTLREPPNTPLKLAAEIDRAVETACRAFGVKLAPLSPAKRLQQLVNSKFAPEVVATFDEAMQAQLVGISGEVPPLAALLAIEQRLTELIIKLRAEYRGRAAKDIEAAESGDAAARMQARMAKAESEAVGRARVVVMLDSIQHYDAALQALITHASIGDTGLGNKEYPVPMVVTFSLKDVADTILDSMVQNQSSYPGWRFLPLRAFQRGGENLLAYTRVLLNPFDPQLCPGVSDKAWVLDDSAPEPIRTQHVGYFERALQGLPKEFSGDVFWTLAMVASSQKVLKVAPDDQIIADEANAKRTYKGSG